jgi:hypothetical protein
MSSEEQELKLYEKIWERVAQEIQLINQRLTWFFTLQGFLFTAYAFTLTAYAMALKTAPATIQTSVLQSASSTGVAPDSDQERFMESLFMVRKVLSSIGVVSAMITVTGITAAHAAVRRHKITWTERPKEIRGQLFLPQIGGQNKVASRGVLMAGLLPTVVAIGWCYLCKSLWLDVGALTAFIIVLADAYWRLTLGSKPVLSKLNREKSV